MQKLILLCLAAVFAAPVAADQCPFSEYLKLAPLATNTNLKPCQDQSGFSLLPPSGYPTKDQYIKMCASKECVALLAAVKALNPSDCDLTVGQVTINAKTIADNFEPVCKSINPTTL